MDILVVDEDSGFASKVQGFLRKRGFSVCAVNNTDDAASFLIGKTPDVLFCNIESSGENGLRGFDLLRRAKKIRPETIVYLWGEMITIDDLPVDLPFDGILLKPFDLDRLARIVRGLRTRSKALRAQANRVCP